MSRDSSSDLAAGVGCVVAGGAAVTLIVAATMLNGFVLRLLWGWHLTPVVRIPAPSLAVCIGLAALASALQNPPTECECANKKESSGWGALAKMFLRPLLLLLVGWVAYRFAR